MVVSSNITRTKTIRIPNEVADWLDRVDARQILTDLYESNGNPQNTNGVHIRYGELAESEEDLDDIKQMTQFWNSTLSGIIKDLRLKMNSGAISAKDNEILINECPFSFDKFIEACNEKGIDYQKAIDKATQMVWRG